MFSFLKESNHLQQIEDQVDKQMSSIASLVDEEREETVVTIDEDFPESFRRQMEELCVGGVEWTRFFSKDDVCAVHGRMDGGAVIKEHRFKDVTSHLYLIEGRLINWSRDSYDGDIVVPADEVEEAANLLHDPSINGWYRITETDPHWIQALIDSHFVIKFSQNDR